MKTLVAYYSKTGNTKKIAEKIARLFGADVDEIILIGEKQIKFGKNPEEYDLVIVGTPVNGFRVSNPTKQYLHKNKDKIKKVAFFCTHWGILGKTFKEMETLSKKPVASLKIKKRKIHKSENKIKEFHRKVHRE